MQVMPVTEVEDLGCSERMSHVAHAFGGRGPWSFVGGLGETSFACLGSDRSQELWGFAPPHPPLAKHFRFGF